MIGRKVITLNLPRTMAQRNKPTSNSPIEEPPSYNNPNPQTSFQDHDEMGEDEDGEEEDEEEGGEGEEEEAEAEDQASPFKDAQLTTSYHAPDEYNGAAMSPGGQSLLSQLEVSENNSPVNPLPPAAGSAYFVAKALKSSSQASIPTDDL